MKPNPDDRRDNVKKIQNNIDMTVRNIRLADDLIEATDNAQIKEDLEAKNERREQALEGLRREIKDEADAREKGHKG